MSVRRVKSKAICFLGPLPDDLPKPAHLKAELQGVCINHNLEKIKRGNLISMRSLRDFVRLGFFVL